MKSLTQVSFRFILSFVLAALVIPVSGCNKKTEVAEKKPVVTIENLQTAYGIALKRATWYRQYAEKARKDRRSNAAFLFQAVSRSEEIHATNHAALLRMQGVEPAPVQIDSVALGSVTQSLKMALSSESLEFESLYPNLIRSAEVEKFDSAAHQFKMIGDSDARHSQLFKEAADRDGNIGRATYYICPQCGYIITSAKTDECPTCKVKKDRFEKI
ncbi:MAG: ferritin family protein [Bacteroidota bacterium]